MTEFPPYGFRALDGAPTYPARPVNGGYLTDEIVENLAGGVLWRAKLDGDRVLVDIDEKVALNRHLKPYTKGKDIPWDGLRKFYDTIAGDNFHAIYQDPRWVDIEWCNKHDTMKGYAVILDVPMRRCPFLEFVERIDSAYKLNHFGGSYSHITHAIHENVGVLPWWGDGTLSAGYKRTRERSQTMRKWEELKIEAKYEMDRTGETTPFIEGLVSVQANSAYPSQLRSPTEKTGDWIKYRFSK